MNVFISFFNIYDVKTKTNNYFDVKTKTNNYFDV